MVDVVVRKFHDRINLSWRDIEKDLFDQDAINNGYIAALWAISPQVLEKAFIAQSWVRSARIGIALERYRLKFGNYPDTLGQVEEFNPGLILSDAWSGDTMLYERLGKDGFQLRMENTEAAQKLSFKTPYHWRVLSEIPSVPQYKEPKASRNSESYGDAPVMDIEMMKRYGLIPLNTPSNVPESDTQTP